MYVTTFVSIENETKNKIKQENLNCKKCVYTVFEGKVQIKDTFSNDLHAFKLFDTFITTKYIAS